MTIKFGDNDTLGALVANLVEADALVILTDQKGLYSADPRKDPAAVFIHEAKADAALEDNGGRRRFQHRARRHDHQGAGGPPSAAGSGASTVIAWGREPDALLRLVRGESIGTLLVAQTQKKQARKQWMADHLQALRGAVVVDDGAVGKVRDEGKSLLPIGMTAVEGDFSRGDVIAIRSGQGREIARGLSNYSSAEARLICRKPSSEFERLLGLCGRAPKWCTGITSWSRASWRVFRDPGCAATARSLTLARGGALSVQPPCFANIKVCARCGVGKYRAPFAVGSPRPAAAGVVARVGAHFTGAAAQSFVHGIDRARAAARHDHVAHHAILADGDRCGIHAKLQCRVDAHVKRNEPGQLESRRRRRLQFFPVRVGRGQLRSHRA